MARQRTNAPTGKARKESTDGVICVARRVLSRAGSKEGNGTEWNGSKGSKQGLKQNATEMKDTER